MTLERACPECGHPLEGHFGDLCAGDESMTDFCRCRGAIAPDVDELDDFDLVSDDVDELDDFDLVSDDVDEAAATDLREWVELRLAGASESELRALAGDR